MRTVLHIGTHKTGTSSLQNFLSTNADILAGHGIHYGLGTRSGRNVNFIAADIAGGRHEAARAFLEAAADAARDADCDTLLLSAESLYAMTAFFRLLLEKPVEDYWAHEHRCIETLRDLLPPGEVRIIGYLRRQDRFLESLYNQYVKQPPGYSRDIHAFIREARPVANYARHLDAWTDVFGADALTVRVYEDVADTLIDDFLDQSLAMERDATFRPEGASVNEQLPPDLLAFKRALNRVPMPLTEAYVASRTVMRLARDRAPQRRDATLLTNADRHALLQAHKSGNEALAARYPDRPRDTLFPSPELPETDTAQALTVDEAFDLAARYRREMSRPRIQAEILARRMIRGLLERVPALEMGLGGIRRLLNRRRVRLEREGLHLATGHKAKRFEAIGDSGRVICEHDGEEVTIEFDRVLIALGRKARTRGFGLEALGVRVSGRGTIETDPFLRTNFPNILVCGDVAGPYQFTHVAAHQAWFASVNALLAPFWSFRVDYRVIPWATFTEPEVARVGLSETEAREQDIDYDVTRYGIDDLDRAIADSADSGFVKVLTEPGKDRILGATIVGSHAGELIAELILAMKHGLGLNKILGTIHIYPTMNEANKFAAGEWKKARKPEAVLRLAERFFAWRRR